MNRPPLLDQTPAMRAEDEARQKDLRARALASVPGKGARTLDFLDRSVAETEAQYRDLFADDDEGRAQLSARLDFLRGERDRIFGLKP